MKFLIQKIKKEGVSFSKLAKELSEDEASKKEGGILGDLHPENTISEIDCIQLRLYGLYIVV